MDFLVWHTTIYTVHQPATRHGLMSFIWHVGLLYDNNILDKAEGASDIFSMCFGEQSGILGIGGIDSSLYNGSIYWVDIQNPAFYTLRLRGIQIGNHSIPIVFFFFLWLLYRQYQQQLLIQERLSSIFLLACLILL